MLLMPFPQKLELKKGQFFLNKNIKIVLDVACSFEDLETATLLQNEVKKILGYTIFITKSFVQEEGSIFLAKSGENSESYELLVTETGVEINGKGSAGLFYGVQTFLQLIKENGVNIPCLIINDEPYFKNRGFYHDVTRGKIPTLDTLKEIVDRLAFYKINQLQLYIEHSFAFEKMSEVWIGKDPLTSEEILKLDEYCKKRHIELVPSIATFGHLYEILSSNSYQNLCEIENSVGNHYSWVHRQIHHTLDVSNSKSIKLVEYMIDEFLPLFTSDKFNICCDETFDLGKGKNLELANKVGTGRLYVDFLNKIINIVKKHNKKVMFWGDIILNHPELLGEIPSDVICLNWFYDVNPKEENTKIISESGMDQYVCPGVNTWNRFMCNFDVAFPNITKMIEYGKKYGAVGVLNTDWGDFGHVNLLANSIPGMIYGAALSWNPDGEKNFDKIFNIISKIEYGDKSGKIIGILRELSKSERINWWHLIMWKESKVLKDPKLIKWIDVFKNIKDEEIILAYYNSTKYLKELISITPSISREKNIDLDEFIISAQGLPILNSLFLVIKKYDFGQKDTTLLESPKDIAIKLEYWFFDYSRIWRIRNKESELYKIRENINYFCNFLRNIK
ncbi:Glycosyl hydrolase family 20, catalytic domain [Clostridium sp. USBA 49]|uniref:glycoside hydrolase family 20 zincin-like fold domain-containing protein n=1 Tax=Clostridium sp. USBA 49 TaxID=1881060 RepID=UPI000999306F|nr:glycoside hydrolase family 20 zincin-like fold domain-containing protein [Clostridium sp. USBA 49]SKA85442.1 Glycosyl hydrolase family 20, catalytic domain [Clostridium sp. USBA 49]